MYSPHSPTLSGAFGDQSSFAGLAANQHVAHQFQHHSPSSLASSGRNNNNNNHNNNNSNHLHYNQHDHQYPMEGAHLGLPYSASYSATGSSRRTASNAGQFGAPAELHHANSHLTSQHHGHLQQKTSVQCLRFKYFTIFFVCTTCLVLLAASLATHKWLVARPVRQLRLAAGGQRANLTALMLTLAGQDAAEPDARPRWSLASGRGVHQQAAQLAGQEQAAQAQAAGHMQATMGRGEIYFGLFSGVKVLNYGLGDRVSQLSVVHAYASSRDGPRPESLVNFTFWLLTLAGVALAILFALVGSIFAIINFVMTPRGTIAGPAGLVIWNAAACFACLLAIFAWLAEYFLRLKSNVLTQEEVQNGWTSENRAQFGYSYYLVLLAFVLHLVNIFVVSIVQADTWTSAASYGKAAKRQARSACDGVIMLY